MDATKGMVTMRGRIRELIEKSVSDNTKSAYAKDLSQFSYYCHQSGLEVSEMGGKALERVLLSFASWYFDINGAKTATVKRKVYAIASLLDITPSREFKRMLAGIKNENIETGNTAGITKAVSMDMIRREVYSNREAKNFERDRALILCLFFGAFRVSELLEAKIGNLTKSGQGYELRIFGTKTNKTEQGHLKILPLRDDSICPTRALDSYFVSVSQNNNKVNLKNDVLFSLSRVQVNRIVKKWFGDSYSSHSLRAGFITEAIIKGIDKKAIKNQTGHKTDAMIDYYTKDDLNRARNAAYML